MSVPVKLPTTRPTAPQWKTATKSTIAATVMSTFATLAIAYCVDRSSTRKSAVSCWKFVCAHRPTAPARTSVGSWPSPIQWPIGEAKTTPSTSPSVDIAHREPERRADHRQLLRRLLRVEVEAEERARDPELQRDREHRRRRGHELDAAVRAGRQVVRVEREQQRREDPRHEPAEPVDRGVLAEPLSS